jgi:hypothetical protein
LIGMAAPFLAPANCASPKCLGVNCGAAGLSEGADHPPTTRRLCTASNIRGDAEGEKGARHHFWGEPRVLGVAKVKARADAAEKSGNCAASCSCSC